MGSNGAKAGTIWPAIKNNAASSRRTSAPVLNGFLISRLDRIPSEDEKPEIVYEGCRFSVLKVENKMIKTVKVERILEEESHEEA